MAEKTLKQIRVVHTLNWISVNQIPLISVKHIWPRRQRRCGARPRCAPGRTAARTTDRCCRSPPSTAAILRRTRTHRSCAWISGTDLRRLLAAIRSHSPPSVAVARCPQSSAACCYLPPVMSREKEGQSCGSARRTTGSMRSARFGGTSAFRI